MAIRKRQLIFYFGCAIIALVILAFVGIVSADDEFEQNDKKSQASEVEFKYYGDLYWEDDDWYRLSLRKGDDIKVTISFDGTSMDLELIIEDAEGNEIDRSSTSEGTETVQAVDVEAGWYYISVTEQLILSNDGNYVMRISGDTDSSEGAFDGLLCGGIGAICAICIFFIVTSIFMVGALIWVYRDARSRGMNATLWLIFILLGNVVGLIVYLVVRRDHSVVYAPPGKHPRGTNQQTPSQNHSLEQNEMKEPTDNRDLDNCIAINEEEGKGTAKKVQYLKKEAKDERIKEEGKE